MSNIIHINQRHIRFKGIIQNACLIQNTDEYNTLEKGLLKKGLNYQRYEHDYDFFKSSSKNSRCNYVNHQLEIIECLNNSETISGDLIKIEKIEIPFMNYTEEIDRYIYEEIKNNHFYLLLVHIINETTFDYDLIDFYDEEQRKDVLNNYTLYPSEDIINIL